MKKLIVTLTVMVSLQAGYMEDTLGIHCKSIPEYYAELAGDLFKDITAKQKIDDMINKVDDNESKMGIVPFIKKRMPEINKINKEIALINEQEVKIKAEMNQLMAEWSKELNKQEKLLAEINKKRERHNEIISGIKSDHQFVEVNDTKIVYTDNFVAKGLEFNDTLTFDEINSSYQGHLNEMNWSKLAQDRAKPLVSHKLGDYFRARRFEYNLTDCYYSNNSNKCGESNQREIAIVDKDRAELNRFGDSVKGYTREEITDIYHKIMAKPEDNRTLDDFETINGGIMGGFNRAFDKGMWEYYYKDNTVKKVHKQLKKICQETKKELIDRRNERYSYGFGSVKEQDERTKRVWKYRVLYPNDEMALRYRKDTLNNTVIIGFDCFDQIEKIKDYIAQLDYSPQMPNLIRGSIQKFMGLDMSIPHFDLLSNLPDIGSGELAPFDIRFDFPKGTTLWGNIIKFPDGMRFEIPDGWQIPEIFDKIKLCIRCEFPDEFYLTIPKGFDLSTLDGLNAKWNLKSFKDYIPIDFVGQFSNKIDWLNLDLGAVNMAFSMAKGMSEGWFGCSEEYYKHYTLGYEKPLLDFLDSMIKMYRQIYKDRYKEIQYTHRANQMFEKAIKQYEVNLKLQEKHLKNVEKELQLLFLRYELKIIAKNGIENQKEWVEILKLYGADEGVIYLEEMELEQMEEDYRMKFGR